MKDAQRSPVELVQAAQSVLQANPNATNRQIMDAVPGFREGWVVKYLLLPRKTAKTMRRRRR